MQLKSKLLPRRHATSRQLLQAFWAAVLTLAGCLALRVTAADYPPVSTLAGKIVYSRALKGDQWDIYLSDADGGHESPLTLTKDVNPIGEENPRFSPDGTEIMFTTLDRDGEKATVWRMPAGGGPPTVVVDADGRGQPSWRPDGKAIAYSGARPPGQGLSTYDLKLWSPSGKQVIVASADRDEHESDWSPDGRTIVYEVERPDKTPDVDLNWGLRKVGADGLGDALLVDERFQSERHPRFAPDGNRLAYISYPSSAGAGRGKLTVLDLASGVRTQLVDGVAGPMAWSPDGQWLMFYNTIEEGPEPIAPSHLVADRAEQPPQLLGLYVLHMSDRAIFRLKSAAGGAGAKENGYEWGFSPDWYGERAAPTPTPTLTPVPTATRTATATATWTQTVEATPVLTAVPTNTATMVLPTATATADGPSNLKLYLPSLYLNFQPDEATPTPLP